MASKSKFNKSVSKDDELDFKITFDNVYRTFTSQPHQDVFEHIIRSEFRTKASKLPPEQMKEKLLMLKQKIKKDIKI